MASEMPKMPKAIWVKPTVSMTFVQIGFGEDDGARREMSGKWRNDKKEGGTAYIRADLAVLATTHQRAIETLREAAQIADRLDAQVRAADGYAALAVVKNELRPTVWELQNGHFRDLAQELRATVARIKEATDGR